MIVVNPVRRVAKESLVNQQKPKSKYWKSKQIYSRNGSMLHYNSQRILSKRKNLFMNIYDIANDASVCDIYTGGNISQIQNNRIPKNNILNLLYKYT